MNVTDKAEMWDALMSCDRIRLIGWSAIGDVKHQHIGLELWSNYPGLHPDEDKACRERFCEFVKAMLPKKEGKSEVCPDCGRKIATNAVECADGYCPKNFAYRDNNADKDCELFAKMRKDNEKNV
jgi:hypothetical protein